MAKMSALFNVSRLIDESNGKEVPINTSFSEDLKRCIEKCNEHHSNPSQYYKPSALSCIRNMYYQRTGTTVDLSPTSVDMIGIAESGTDRHLRIQYYLTRMKDFGIDCEYVDVPTYIKENNLTDLEVRESTEFETKLFNKKYNISFMVDGIIKYRGIYYILEIKTESSYKWNVRNTVDESHHNQAFAYALSLHLNQVMFIYENRDTCAKKCYLFDVSQSDIDSIVKKIESCEAYVHTRIVPDKPDNLPAKVCNYCAYKSTCRTHKGDNNNEQTK